MLEIERKFLIDPVLWKPKKKGEKVIQGYLSTDKERVVRVRTKGDKAFLTIKGKMEGISRTEMEYEIPVEDAQILLKMCLFPPVEKIRFTEVHLRNTWEIDVFEGENQGLLIAEIELESEEQDFELPDWITDEVTHDQRFYNSYLSRNPYLNW